MTRERSGEPRAPLTRKRLRTPRAAAYAGIVFAVLMGTSMLLIQTLIPLSEPYDPSWLEDHEGALTLAVTLVPFAGIAFLWFMGVIRDQLGEREDQLFSTIFFGSGLLLLGALFLWISLIGAMLASGNAGGREWQDSDAFTLGAAMIEETGGTIALRMAGVFLISTGTIWLRTGTMPRWLVAATFVLALAMLVGGGEIRELRLAFPLWVLLVSLMVLLQQRRIATA
jgi:hypothetical protein